MTTINAQINTPQRIYPKSVTLHDVTAASVGLENVDNTSDVDKPISTLTQAALDLKASQSNLDTHTSDTTNPHSVTADQVGLGNVDNKSSATIRSEIVDTDIPSSITRDSELTAHTSLTNNPHGVTQAQVGLGNVDNTSDADKPISTLTQSALDLKANQSSLDIHISDTANPHGTTAASVGLENVDNTSDVDKPVSTAQQSALDLKANKNNPQITGGMTIAGTTIFSDGASSIVVSTIPADPQNVTGFTANSNSWLKISATAWTNNDLGPRQEIFYTGTRWELQDLGTAVYFAVNGSETYPWDADWSQTGGGNLTFTNFIGGTVTDINITLEQYAIANSDACVYASSGADLQAAYDFAKTLTPSGSPLSASNRATLVIMPGHYSGNLAANNSFIDIYGLGHQPKSVGCKVSVFIDGYIQQLQSDVTLSGLEVKGVIGQATEYYCVKLTDSGSDNKFADSSTLINCESNGDITLGGFYGIALNVVADSFVDNNTMGGRMENCETRGNPILQRTNISGVVINCRGNNANSYQFGHAEFASTNVSGTIKQCATTAPNTFGRGTSTALFEDCTGGSGSFGVNADSVSGTYIRCKASANSFGNKTQTLTGNTLTVDGTFVDCEAGSNSFGYTNLTAITVTFDGTAKRCVADYTSFGSAQGAAGSNGTGQIGSNALIENCTAGGRSFGRDGNFGKVLRCTSTFAANPALATFRADGTTGKVRLCLDGTYTEQNLG